MTVCEQSRCHSSDGALNTDSFSPDKWTQATSWMKQLSPKPTFLSPSIFYMWGAEVPNLCTTVRCPHPVVILILEWFKIGSWITFQRIPQESARENSFNLHFNQTKDASELSDFCSQQKGIECVSVFECIYDSSCFSQWGPCISGRILRRLDYQGSNLIYLNKTGEFMCNFFMESCLLLNS